MCKVDDVPHRDKDYPQQYWQSVLVVVRCCVEGEEREEDFDSGSL